MRDLTRLEVHFLHTLTRAVKDREARNIAVSELLLLFPDGEPGLNLALRLPDSPLFFARVLIYGSRPVRYQIETAGDALSARSRSLWDQCLGPLNLVEDKTWLRQGRLQLFYEVAYPDSFLKRLGE